MHWQRLSLWYGLAFTVNQKWKNKIYTLKKADDRIQILQLARFNKKDKKTPRYESRKMFLNRAQD